MELLGESGVDGFREKRRAGRAVTEKARMTGNKPGDAFAGLANVVRGGDPSSVDPDPREAHLERLRKVLAEGLAQADRGELLDGPEVLAQVREMLRRPPKPRNEEP